jgi:hypothetical protein
MMTSVSGSLALISHERLDAVLLRHHDVHADDVGFQSLDHLDGRQPVAGFADDVVFLAAQHAAQDAAHHVVVVGDDDGKASFAHVR